MPSTTRQDELRELAEFSAQLDALALPVVAVAPDPDFVNRTCPATVAEARRLLAKTLVWQGVNERNAKLLAGVRIASLLDKGGKGHTPNPTITQRALQALHTRRAHARANSPSSRRHAVQPLEAFKRLSAIPGTIALKADLRLSPDVQRSAFASKSGDPTDWLRRRINRYVAEVLGEAPAMILASGIRSASGPSLHAHMILAVPPEKRKAVEEALRRAGGRVRPSFRAHQLKTCPALPGHALYCHDNAEEARRSRLVQGKTFVVSNHIRASACRLPAALDDKSLMIEHCPERNDYSKVSENSLESVNAPCENHSVNTATGSLSHDHSSSRSPARRHGEGYCRPRARSAPSQHRGRSGRWPRAREHERLSGLDRRRRSPDGRASRPPSAQRLAGARHRDPGKHRQVATHSPRAGRWRAGRLRLHPTARPP